MTVIPAFLKPGDTIGITAPSRKVTPKELEGAIETLKMSGYKVILAPHLFEVHFQFAGTDEQRAKDLQFMIDHPEIKLIWCARGGYGLVRIVDKLDFSNLLKYPKWIAGFSDITVLHSRLYNLGIASLHAPMAAQFGTENENNALYISKESKNYFLDAIQGHLTPLQGNSYSDENIELNAILTGGNLSVLYSLSGSRDDNETKGNFLFLEDLDEYNYHLDRMCHWLKRAGKTNDIKALLLGSLNKMKDLNPENPFGYSPLQMFKDTLMFDIPLIYNLPVGHEAVNNTLILGVNYTLSVSGNKAILSASVNRN